jgi:hypothetical protein
LRGVALAALMAATLLAAWRVARSDLTGPPVLRVQFDGSPTAIERDSLGALARAGRNITWAGDIAPLAVMAEPVREPGMRWRIAAVGSAPLIVRDSLGVIDSLAPAAALTLEPTRGPAQLVQGSSVAAAVPQDVAPPRRAMVLGRVGWESRFIITALEEAGWSVDARLALGREREVQQGEALPRTERHDVVIVTDSSAANANGASLARFVRGGGGVILAGEAAGARAPALRAIAGSRVQRMEAPETESFEGHEPTHALPLYALGDIASDASLLEDREGTPAVVARRVEAGRVMQLGYAETWRWRMQGEGRSVEEHRAYWSRLAGLVARGDTRPAAVTNAGDAAPLAAVVQAIGLPSEIAAPSAAGGPSFPTWLGPIILLALLAEWGSRRRRGAP